MSYKTFMHNASFVSDKNYSLMFDFKMSKYTCEIHNIVVQKI